MTTHLKWLLSYLNKLEIHSIFSKIRTLNCSDEIYLTERAWVSNSKIVPLLLFIGEWKGTTDDRKFIFSLVWVLSFLSCCPLVIYTNMRVDWAFVSWILLAPCGIKQTIVMLLRLRRAINVIALSHHHPWKWRVFRFSSNWVNEKRYEGWVSEGMIWMWAM